ncbi:MAG: CsbD family protein [Firmicutes bacterium HGW-Firmicutes-11]|jgi:uncharacterized protein YjbJ (UPF0337 family)|nr:MAG: CsbD family protein [Firmicutes bacterium HGW-Firmicutes-11]
MSKLDRDLDHAKNKVSGEMKEAAGKITGNEQLELKGKMQSAKADLKKNMNVSDKIEDVKESIAESANNAIDKNNKKYSRR